MKAFLLLILSGLLSSEGVSQEGAAITGHVGSAATGEGLEFANVFLSQTTFGSASDSDGTYRLRSVPPGVYQLVVSRVGYAPQRVEITLVEGEMRKMDFLLEPREVRAEEVRVEGAEPEAWKRQLGKFQKAFLGQTDNARECRILNPFVIDFRTDSTSGMLVAEAESTLVVENRALGYRVSIVLEHFQWDTEQDIGRYSIFPHFEALEPSSPDEETRWSKNRARTYRGSLKEFLSLLIAHRLDESMFSVASGSLDNLRAGNGLVVGAEAFTLLPNPLPGFLKLEFSGWVRVDDRGVLPTRKSYLKLSAPYATIDRRGNVFTPFDLLVSGEWARARVADLLPLDAQ